MRHPSAGQALSATFAVLAASALPAQLEVGAAAPAVEFKAAIQTSARSLADFKGKVVMVDLFATW
jgi:hypothetical protein